MMKNSHNSTHIQHEPSAGLFDKIILAIKLEKELRQSRKLLLIFVLLFVVSAGLLPFSSMRLASEWKSSGVGYFISLAIENTSVFFSLWQDFLLSILESIPVAAILLFSMNLALLIFTIRLFLYKKGLLLKYLHQSFA